MKICVFGDSIAWGAVDLVNGGWVNQLKKFFENKAAKIKVDNLSIPGADSKSLLWRFKWQVFFRRPQVIIFAIGINDCVFDLKKNTYKYSLEQSLARFKKLLKQAKSFSQKIIFIGLTNVDEKKTCPMLLDKSICYYNRRIKELDREIARLANENDLPYFSCFGQLENKELIDGLHPDQRGQEKLFQLLKPKIIKQLSTWKIYQP